MKASLQSVILMFLAWGNPAGAITISGTIRDSGSVALPGAMVRIIRSNQADTSDALGKFSIQLPVTGVNLPNRPGMSKPAPVSSGDMELYRVDGSRARASRGSMLEFGRPSGNAAWVMMKSAAVASTDTLVVEKAGYAAYRKPISLAANASFDIRLDLLKDTVFAACNAAINSLGSALSPAAYDSALAKLDARGNVCAEQAAAIAALTGISRLPNIQMRALLQKANAYLGVPYLFGAGPYDQTKVFDCSSFTRFIFGKFGVTLPRTASEQSQLGVRIANRNLLRPGDLVFFHVSSRTVEVGHVGIYIGNGKMINANTGPEDGVQISTINWTRYLFGAKLAL
jgi:cell wall-associated NlpC family hydrolase